MAPSQVTGMKMRNFLFGVTLGLLAVVHSTPVYSVTQTPVKTEDDVLREAATDGFLIDHFFLPSLTTESPKRNTTVQASQQPSSDSKRNDMIEGSGLGETVFLQHGGEEYATTTQSVSHAESSTSTVLPRDTDNSSSDSPTQSPQSSFTSSSVPNEAQSSVTPDHITASQTTDPAVSSFDFLSTLTSDSGSGDGEVSGQYPSSTSSITSSSDRETSTASSTSRAAPHIFEGSEGSGSGSGSESEMLEEIKKSFATQTKSRMGPLINGPQSVEEPVNPESQNKGHSTPGWIIIVGFIAGVAALVMLCVAIATRDKWNGPKQASQLETNTNSSNQQREVEMETFLHKDNPRENGKAEEYTVIPLDELPEKYSSH
ncbi:uncharacterized protein [Enoplosus armatus]|uniref:uncharacterized protein n=1 Tax=Enoplosus armatus TaxID=215367 RepID=UPI00399144A0